MQVRPDRPRPDPPVGRAIPRDDATALSGAEHDGPPGDRREHGRVLEVVVADVVRCHLVVPEQPAGRPGEDDQRVGEERAAGEEGTVRERPRPTPRRRVRGPGVDIATLVDADRVPDAAAARPSVRPGASDGLEPPDELARLRGEGVQRAAPAGREALGAVVHAAAVDDGGDRDELLVPGRQPALPEQLPGRGVERQGGRVGRRVDPAADDREAVRPVVRSGERVLPAECAVRGGEGVDARARVLHVHGAPGDDRIRRDRAEGGCTARETEGPADAEMTDRPGVQRRRRHRPPARDAAVRDRPRPRGRSGLQDEGCQHECDCPHAGRSSYLARFSFGNPPDRPRSFRSTPPARRQRS